MAKKLDDTLQELIDERISEALKEVNPQALELITIDAAAEICGGDKPLDRSVMVGLIDATETTGFPAIRLGPRTIRIDKKRLIQWLQSGGLIKSAAAKSARRT